ncbi:Tfp pilus assembly protein tip-associated adhesin PilY1-like protein [Oleiphilus messinensis]|uniref:Tfp pilus assembly protein tip-associated adhesin PilY1-like protein n=1 Tax=Oleiphilus messinensis TaxID=141451 RepID=A0A1Y0I3V7_9GAMM|nr:PilC/PilY family type IV pilus protein [Oleiphilus messinensis]ARU54920.1 Tfp pilus assembly protein tip-associated adhesin PilY1-like protein [Oleiphilus messinensis]
MNTKQLHQKSLTATLACLYTLLGSGNLHADDTEVYFGASTSGTVVPNIMFIMDTSGSMDGEVSGDDRDRLEVMQDSLTTILDSATGINVGLMRFSSPGNYDNNGGPILYPVRYIDDAVADAIVTSQIEQDSDDATENTTDSSVSLNDNTIIMTQSQSSGVEFASWGSNSDYAEGSSTGTCCLYAGFGTEHLGFRFTDIDIAKGMTIDSAYLLMESNRSDNSGTVKIKIEDNASPQNYSAGPPAGRSYLSTNIDWTVPTGGSGVEYTSPDISTLVQQIINKSDWNTGQAIAFYLDPEGGNRSLCTPSYYNGCDAPILQINWHDDTSSSANRIVGLRFGEVNIPQGATITSAYIEFTSSDNSSVDTNLSIVAHKSANSAPFTNSSGDISLRGTTTAVVPWNSVSDWTNDEVYQTPDLKNLVEEVVAESDWCGGNAMSFIISGTGTRKFTSHDSDPGSAPRLVVEYDENSAVGNCMQDSVVKQINSNNNDAEFSSGGSANSLSGSNLDFDENSYIGLRFTDMQIPKDAEITSAYISFIANTESTDTKNMSIYSVDDANPAAFNSTPLLSTLTGSSSTSWTNNGWVYGETVITSDISDRIEEIVSKPTWTSGNALGIIIETTDGNGTGSATSYNSSAGSAPKLFVTYKGDYAVGGVTVRDTLKSYVANFGHDGYTPISGTLAEAALYFRGSGVKFGTKRGSSGSRKFRTSHPDSYTGGTHYIPNGCPGWDSSNSNCGSEAINGSPVYISPIDNLCAPNHIMFLSDGEPNSHGSTTAGVVQGITGESCSTGDNGKNCAKELAEFLVTEDQSSTLSGTQTVVTNTISFASNIPFMAELAQAGGGTFYQANNEAELVQALSEGIKNALDKTTSFVSAGVTVNQFNRLTNDDDLYFSLFKPTDSTDWPGNVKRYKFDTDSDSIVDVNTDPAITADGAFEEGARSFWKPSYESGTAIDDGNDVAKGGAAASMPSSRNVYTYLGTSSTLANSSNALSEDNSVITQAMLNVSNSTEREQVLKWARGVDVDDFDSDSNTTEIRLQMGDPLHSRPVLVRYDNSGTSQTVLFVATNQGYLHAINADDGDSSHTDDGNELWSFVPSQLLGNLKLFRDNSTGISHVYGLDGPITINHIDTDNDNLVDSDEKVYLYIGMRRGGRNYYALDISDYDNPKMLFVIQGGTGDYLDLGQTWSSATPATIKWDGDSKDVIIFGGGYDVTQDSEDTTPLADGMGQTVFIADAITGALLWSAKANAGDPALTSAGYDIANSKATVTLTNSIPGDIRAIDFNNNGVIDTLYASDTNAQVFRFDINETNTGVSDFATGGRIAHLNATTVAGNRRFYYSVDPSLVVLNNDERFVALSVGSGYRAHPLNKSTDEHFFVLRDYGVLENKFDHDIALSDLADVSEAATDTSARALIDASAGKGWYINLANTNVGKSGEKVTAPSLTVNNTVIFSTYIPPASANVGACTPSEGTGRTWFVDILDGTPLESRMADIENPELTDRHTEENVAGLPPGVIPLFTEEGMVLLEGKNVLAAPPSPPGDPLKVYRRRKGRAELFNSN